MISEESEIFYNANRAKMHAYETMLCVLQQQELSAQEAFRPFMLLRPKMYPDGNQWCALYGENIQEGVCAFGDTPAEAAKNFDSAWIGEKVRPTK